MLAAIFIVCKQFRPRLDTTELLIYTKGKQTLGGEMTNRGNDYSGNPKARVSRDMSLNIVEPRKFEP